MIAQRLIPPILLIISILFFALSFTIEGQSVVDVSSAAFMPALVGVVMILCSLLIFRRGNKAPSSQRTEGTIEEENLVEIEEITKKQLAVRILLFLIGVGLFAFLMNYIHFMVVSFLFLFLIMMMLNRKKIFTSLIISGLMSIIFYYLFSGVFKIVFPS